jgi:hypothetical protein
MLSAFEDAQELYPKDSWKQKTILLHLKKLNNHTQKMAGNKSHTSAFEKAHQSYLKDSWKQKPFFCI